MTAATRPVPGSDQALFGDDDPRISYSRVYFALQRIQRTLMPGIEKSLREIGVTDPIWYEILLAAEEAGEQGIQMLTLQKRLFVPQYALSRHMARLEKAGLIRREASGGAGRAQLVWLTENARGMQAKIWKIYNDRIQEAFGSAMSSDEAYALVRMLNRLYH